MRRRYELAPVNGLGPPLEFEWDPITGELAGRNAGVVRAAVEKAQRAGYEFGHPHPTPYAMTDPLRRPGELAVVLGTNWILPPELQAAYPAPPADNEVPDGALA